MKAVPRPSVLCYLGKVQVAFHQIVYMPRWTVNDVDRTKRSKLYGGFFLELCTDLARFMKTTGKKATKVGGWL